MVTVTTKEELELALNTKEASILIKGELAKTMRKKKKGVIRVIGTGTTDLRQITNLRTSPYVLSFLILNYFNSILNDKPFL